MNLDWRLSGICAINPMFWEKPSDGLIIHRGNPPRLLNRAAGVSPIHHDTAQDVVDLRKVRIREFPIDSLRVVDYLLH